MGLREEIAKILISVKADTSQAKAEVRSLRGVEKTAAQDRLKEIEKTNAGIDASIKKWVALGAAVVVGQKVFSAASEAAKAYMEHAKKSGAAGVGMAKDWQRATDEWKKSTESLELQFGRLVIALGPVIEKMAKAAEIASAMVEDLLGGGGRPAETGTVALMEKRRTEIQNTLRTRGLLEGGDPRAAFYGLKGGQIGGADDYQLQGELQELNTLIHKMTVGRIDEVNAELMVASKYIGEDARKKLLKELKKGRGSLGGGKTGPELSLEAFMGGARGIGAAGSAVYSSVVDPYVQQAKSNMGGYTETLGAKDAASLTAAGAKINAQIEQAKKDMLEIQDIIAANEARKVTYLESIFGPVEQFNAYAAGFQLLEGAATAAFDAWITGQQSIGEAVKAAIATGLKAVAIEMAIQALRNTAYGFAALAMGPIGGVSAAGYFKAAALFGAGAAAAGVAAHQMYGAGWAGGSGGGGGGGGGSSPSAHVNRPREDDAGPRSVTIMLGSDFGMLTSIEQKQLLRGAISLGLHNRRSTKRVRRG